MTLLGAPDAIARATPSPAARIGTHGAFLPGAQAGLPWLSARRSWTFRCPVCRAVTSPDAVWQVHARGCPEQRPADGVEAEAERVLLVALAPHEHAAPGAEERFEADRAEEHRRRAEEAEKSRRRRDRKRAEQARRAA